MIDKFGGEFAFLSNFFPAKVAHNGIAFPTVEHAYQAAKTIDVEEMQKIAAAATAGQAKRLGQKVTLRPEWEGIKIAVMSELVRQKFDDPALSMLLLQTGNEQLMEGNTWNDRFWGVCRGKGENWLGKILMQVRSELRNQA